jgi:N-methylhydantoinase A
MIEIAIDIGGTFTDIVALERGSILHMAKVPTTPRDLVEGVRDGVARILAFAGGEPAQVSRFIHSTTIATNAILEQKGAVTGILMTEGFQDALEIGRQKRSDMYNLYLDAETPVFLAPRRMRAGVPERVDADGAVLLPLDEQAVLDAVRRLRERHGVQSVAVCYLFSFLNPAHERRTRELLREHFPELSVSLSCEVDPVFREYERVTVTAFDAYVRPRVSDYLGRLAGSLEAMGIGAHLQVMQSRGGLTTESTATERPVSMLLSGPAAGVIGGCHAAALSGLRDVITVDIGGTSCDVALVRDGRPLISREGRIRSYPLRLSMVDVSTVGAGGGSLAWVDATGGLRVGPQSAGADPGPACYGRGGEVPTVTDASLVMGYLNPATFAAGQMRLDVEAAHEALERMARPLGMDALSLAAGIHRIINERMSDEMRLVSVRRGHDPRRFALVALGGAGPVHAGRMAASLSIPTVLVPSAPGVLAAFGLLVAPVEHEQTRTFAVPAQALPLDAVRAVLAELTALNAARMAADRVEPARVRVSCFADLRYVGQSYELEVALRTPVDAAAATEAVAAFHAAHERVYGHGRPESPVEFVNLRVVHSAPSEPPRLSPPPPGKDLASAQTGERPAFFSELGEWAATPVYERSLLPRNGVISGPAIIEQPDTTTVVYPGQTCRPDAAGNLLITWNP